jgi:serine protease Do
LSVDDLRAVEQRLRAALPAAQQATVAVGYGGSGVIVSRDGYVLSAAHVTGRPERRVTLTLHDGRKVLAESLGASEFADAGMLKIAEEGEWPSAPMAEAGSAKVGDWCFALGHPSGYDAERGAVVRIGRVIAKLRNLVRTDCQLVGGDSGGPLFNLEGEVIGIHSRISEEIDDNYHAPVEAFHRDWNLLIAGETIPRRHGRGGGFLGVLTAAHENGVVIEQVIPDSAAASAQLEAGLVITHVDDYAIGTPEEFALAIRAKQPGDEVSLRYREGQSESAIKVALGNRPRRRSSR